MSGPSPSDRGTGVPAQFPGPDYSPVRREWPGMEHSFWLSLGIALAVVVGTLVLDWFLLRQERLKPMAMAAISDGILGLVSFFLIFRLLAAARQRRRQVVRRLEVIDEMNHHIRNALQVISFNARPASRNDFELAEIKQAVHRIHWTLREILPKIEPEFSPFEGSVRDRTQQDKSSS